MSRIYLYTIITILLCFAFIKKSQSQINETFIDGNFTNNPTWTGNINDFAVVNGQLKSTNTNLNSKFYLSTTSSLATNCQWEFYTNLQFNTSSLNLVDFYLTSNVSNPSTDPTTNAYFIRMGGTKDEINLYKKTAGTETLLINGDDGVLNTSNNIFKIKVIRKQNNTFILYTDSTGNGQNYKFIDSVADNSHTSSNFFSINIAQSTASFFGKHIFDDIYAGPIIVDNVPPALLKVDKLNATRLRLTFNEPIDTAYAKNNLLYSITNSNAQIISNIIKVIPNPQKLNELELILGQAVNNRGTYNCFVSVAKDIAGNIAFNLSQSFLIFEIKKFDLVINELMIDPSPVVGLADAEYIELYNKSGLDINLKNAKLSIGNTTKIITSKDIVIKADSFVVICNTSDTSDLKNALPIFTKLIGIPSLPALTNESNLVQIKNENDDLVHFIRYDEDWYQDAAKKDGGYSLEQKDPLNACGEIENWRASIDVTGGTPGKRNSVFQSNVDNNGPTALAVNVISNDTLEIVFNEKLEPSVIDTNLYFINQGIGKPKSVNAYNSFSKSIKLAVKGNIIPNQLYELSIQSNAKDCNGNSNLTNQVIIFAKTVEAKAGELQINEILFDPLPNGEEYLELYNNSTNYFDLKDYSLAGFDKATQSIIDKTSITNKSRLIRPYEYILLTEKGNVVAQQYPKSRVAQFAEMIGFPSLDDQSETVYLIGANNTNIDQLTYNSSWHYGLLNSTEGVSLERINSQNNTNDKSNWTSASFSENYGTPGYQNSQIKNNSGNEVINLSKNIFFPDNDGYEDVLLISLYLPNISQSVKADVFSANGVKVKSLANNTFIADRMELSWDGVTDNNEKASFGNYVIVVQAYDDKGNFKVYKKLFAVGTK